ncbi:MAG: prolyl oligopeptidase family serine peptidase [Bacteroidales bacterium]|nr:prolyl oligopeptidase family serine peptidase [Bacteroidales bacterium]
MIIYILIVLFAFMNCNSIKIEYPYTKKQNIVEEHFGIKVEDPYRWLENDSSAEVKQWIEAQNKVTFDYLNNIPFRKKIKERLTELVNYERRTIPIKKGKYYVYFKNRGLQNQSVLYITTNLDNEGTVLIDPNKLSEDGTISISAIKMSPDCKYIAYSISQSGSDWQTICFKNIENGQQLKDTLVNVKFSSIAWYDNGIFYSGYSQVNNVGKYTNENKFQKLFYHKIGNKQSDDVIVLENTNDPYINFYAYTNSDDNILCIHEEKAGFKGNALKIIDLNLPKLFIKTIIPNYEYEYKVIERINDWIYVLTNENAPKYSLIKININTLERKTIIPQSNDVISNALIAKNKIIVKYLHNAYSILNVFDLDGNKIKELTLPCIGNVSSLSGNLNDTIIFYEFSSFNYPPTIFKLNVNTLKQEVLFETKIKDFIPEKYIVKQDFYKSKDGTLIPIFIIHKKNINLDGTNPTILYGYGGFNVSLTPSFSATRLFWLEIGGIYAVANLRGGGEFGEEWHLAGTKLNKQNTFDDFISAAEYLIQNKYTSPNCLAIQGASNGGLLVGVVVNQRPDLFKVAIPSVGVMDMLRFHKFTIGWSWITDYGNPDNEKEFKYIYKYSPLHNIKENTNYPAILVTTADHDDRVVPAHSFKYIATLQEKCKGSNPALIRIETKAGHGAGKSLTKIIEEQTDIFSFILFNINPKIKL